MFIDFLNQFFNGEILKFRDYSQLSKENTRNWWI